MADKTIKGVCRTCKKNIEVEQPVGFSAICTFCSEYLHNCLHCKFYDSLKSICNAQVAERPKSPNAKNFCDDYSFMSFANHTSQTDNSLETKKKLANMFKDSSSDDEKPKKSINDLFKEK